ncbi:MAG: hypothetical protein HRF49_00475 [bacterium]
MGLSVVNVKAAQKFGIDVAHIERNIDVEKNVRDLGNDLSFLGVREFERTKHVHRLHPYLGKFIPQLVEVFLRKYFEPGQTVLDPFAGSGTTLVEANALGMNSIGLDISAFNVLIQKVKTRLYNIPFMEKEVSEALARLSEFSRSLQRNTDGLFAGNGKRLETKSEYLNEWFSDRALQEILFYRNILDEYNNKDLMTIILSRAARSARLIAHYDLARPKKPVRGQYWCIKHNRYCEPIDEAYKFIHRYSLDSIDRIKEYAQLRTKSEVDCILGDSRTWKYRRRTKLDGIFTSPPYVGIIDYHEQHRYAYELFDFIRCDEQEIGPAFKGSSRQAIKNYVQGITEVFQNVCRYLKPGAPVLIVANDKFGLYESIGESCGLELEDVYHRPVLMRTERDSNKYFESIFCFRNINVESS